MTHVDDKASLNKSEFIFFYTLWLLYNRQMKW